LRKRTINNSINSASAKIDSIIGPVIIGHKDKNIKDLMMNEIVFVGEDRLLGEITYLQDEIITIQVYEETAGLRRGNPIFRTRELLSVELGPGLLGNIYDGLQRSLSTIEEKTGNYIKPLFNIPKLSKNKKWEFNPISKIGEKISQGDILGIVKENEFIEHKIMVPPFLHGKIKDISKEGEYTIEEKIARIINDDGNEESIGLTHFWPIKKERPFIRKLTPNEPLITGQRVIDTFRPVAKGGTVAIAGGFGVGKTVLEHQLAKFLNTEIIIYVGCGERGNEIADLLQKFPKFKDQKTGLPIIWRTIIIANTSNMPLASREASVYTGITLSEYYRDMGYSVALLVDSTSRWAEALKEISNRMGEMPGEEGYPPYLASRISGFYGRTGKVQCLGKPKRLGSISIIASVSPSGGDFSEPVTQKTLQIVRAFWALDPELAYKRHFPAINLQQSFSLYEDIVEPFWYENVNENWREIRNKALKLHEESFRLERVARLVGTGVLSEKEKITLENSKLLSESFLKQDYFNPTDAFCSLKKQFQILDVIIFFHETSLKAIDMGIPASILQETPLHNEIEKMKYLTDDKIEKAYWNIRTRIGAHFQRIIRS